MERKRHSKEERERRIEREDMYKRRGKRKVLEGRYVKEYIEKGRGRGKVVERARLGIDSWVLKRFTNSGSVLRKS